jgi:16S rRNA pseudouridine516 synthase
MRLDKFLADAGVGTRSEVKKMIKTGRITVNGCAVCRPEQKMNPSEDAVSVDGVSVCYEQFSYYLFHKPGGCVTARTDASFPTVMDFFPAEMRDKFSPVGRLDKDTEGLLLITNDGALNHRLVSPAYHVDKTYYARLDRPVSPAVIEQFAKGIDIGDKKRTLPAELLILPEETDASGLIYAAQLTICEGRFHQVKRMFAAVGCEVIYLKRLSMGSLTLQGLPKGTYRKLTPEEVAKLQESGSDT